MVYSWYVHDALNFQTERYLLRGKSKDPFQWRCTRAKVPAYTGIFSPNKRDLRTVCMCTSIFILDTGMPGNIITALYSYQNSNILYISSRRGTNVECCVLFCDVIISVSIESRCEPTPSVYTST